MTKTAIFWLSMGLLITLAVVASWTMSSHLGGVFAAKTELSLQDSAPAFTAVLNERLQKKGEAPVMVTRITHMRNAAGARRQEYETLIEAKPSMVKIFRPDGMMSTMYPDQRLKRTVHAPPEVIREQQSSWLDPKQNCATSFAPSPSPNLPSLVGTDPILGVMTYKLSLSGELVWRAPALGCLEMKRQSALEGSSMSDMDIVSLTIGEPPPGAFEPDMSFKEMRPIEMERQTLKARYPKMPQDYLERELKKFERMEDFYTQYGLLR